MNWSISQLVNNYAQGELSPVDVVHRCLERIRAAEPGLNAFCLVDEELALTQARSSEDRYRRGVPLSDLDGVPVAVKDLLAVQGWPTRSGSRATSSTPAAMDSPPVARLREAGACLIGKTTTSEFGWKGVTESPLTGVTRNPWDPDRTCGGSSGGSAVAVATGMAAAALGTDAGGSVRIPASLVGLVGVKPTHGRVPAWPPNVFSSFSQAGPLTRTVRDASTLLSIVTRSHGLDPYAYPYPTGHPQDLPQASMTRVRVLGVVSAPFDVDPEVRSATEDVLSVLEGLGAIATYGELPFDDSREIFDVLWPAAVGNLLDSITVDERAKLDPELRAFGERGRSLSVSAVANAQLRRLELAGRLNQLYDDVDVVVTPTLPTGAFPIGHDVPTGFTADNPLCWAQYCYLSNLTGQPAISLPLGMSSHGLPIGVQLVGRRYSDDGLLQIATAIESAGSPNLAFHSPGPSSSTHPVDAVRPHILHEH